jgi:hypothetical protein
VETRTEIGGKDQAFTAYLTVKSLSDEVQRSVQAGGIAPWRAVSAEGLELAAQSVELVSLFLPPPTQEAGELFGAVFSLAGEVTSLIEGDEQGESAVAERIKLEPNQLTQLPTEMEQRVSAAGASFGHGLGLAGIRSREAQRRVRELRARSV